MTLQTKPSCFGISFFVMPKKKMRRKRTRMKRKQIRRRRGGGGGRGGASSSGGATPGCARANALAEIPPPWQSKVEIIKLYIKIFQLPLLMRKITAEKTGSYVVYMESFILTTPRAVPISLFANYTDTVYSRFLKQPIPFMRPIRS